ncbi:MAG: hypothetical protein MUE85_07865 [Microscillaceae bacterium]|nr:hypothetical protein [Microscillaceae bacterium]
MKTILKNILFVCLSTLTILLISCENRLEVENQNNPDISDVAKSTGSVENLPSGGYLRWYYAIDGPGLFTLDVTGDYFSSSWGNFGMRDLGTEPRLQFRNSIAYSNAGGTNLDLWRNLNSALGTARIPLQIINVEGQKVVVNGVDQTAKVKASSEFLQGVAMGYLSMFFDRAYILDETSSLGSIPFSTYQAVRDAAVEKLDKCIATCQANTFTMTYFNGLSLSNQQLAKLANTMAARFIAYNPRTPAESDAANWAKVRDYANAGLDFDFVMQANPSVYFTFARFLSNAGTSADTFWSRIDQRIVSLMSTNGLTRPATQPMRWPVAGLAELTGVTDNRFTTDWTQGAPPFIPGRGAYFFSNYFHTRYTATVDADSGPLNLVLKSENDLLLAEALIRTNGSSTTIANLINNTRVGRGGLPAVTGSETNIYAHVLYERSIELMNSMAGIGFLDGRRLGYINTENGEIVKQIFNAGTIPHYPVPEIELQIVGVPVYTFGGI